MWGSSSTTSAPTRSSAASCASSASNAAVRHVLRRQFRGGRLRVQQSGLARVPRQPAQPAESLAHAHGRRRAALPAWRAPGARTRPDARRAIRGVPAPRSLRPRFPRAHLVPLIASTWSNAPADVLAFPTNYLFRFLDQHGVLSLHSIPEWRWVAGGARRYVEAIVRQLDPSSVHLGTPILGVTRQLGGACVALPSGEERHFDAVVLACHADQALSLLGDASPEESAALGGFNYARNHVVLHTDETRAPAPRVCAGRVELPSHRGGGVPHHAHDELRPESTAGPVRTSDVLRLREPGRSTRPFERDRGVRLCPSGLLAAYARGAAEGARPPGPEADLLRGRAPRLRIPRGWRALGS